MGASEFGPSTSVAPGSWIEIHGTDLASGQRQWSLADFNGLRAPTALSGTRVTIGGAEAFLAYVSPGQINALLPSNTGVGEQQITVTTSTGTSTPYTVKVNWTQPGLYAPSVLKIGGRQYAGAFFDDGATLALPPGAIEGVASRRARPGETIVLFGVGLGPVNPNLDSGEIVEQANALAGRIEVFFGGTPATVAYAGLVQGSLGLYQLNVVVPDIPDNDAVQLSYTVDGVSAAQTLYTAVAK